jgi:hypothetical protein
MCGMYGSICVYMYVCKCAQHNKLSHKVSRSNSSCYYFGLCIKSKLQGVRIVC